MPSQSNDDSLNESHLNEIVMYVTGGLLVLNALRPRYFPGLISAIVGGGFCSVHPRPRAHACVKQVMLKQDNPGENRLSIKRTLYRMISMKLHAIRFLRAILLRIHRFTVWAEAVPDPPNLTSCRSDQYR